MEFVVYINAMTIILTELLKRYVDKKYVPLLSVALGGVLGILYALNYSADMFNYCTLGLIYGASATGIYKATKDLVTKKEGE